ncbi:hypothetical protein ACFTUC_04785 [Streptomyces sp. NPDC056944]
MAPAPAQAQDVPDPTVQEPLAAEAPPAAFAAAMSSPRRRGLAR